MKIPHSNADVQSANTSVKAHRPNGTRNHELERRIASLADDLRTEIQQLREDIRRLREEPPPEQKLLTAKQVAEKLQISIRTLRTITDTGELPCIRVRGSIRYDRRMVDAYISRQARGGGL